MRFPLCNRRSIDHSATDVIATLALTAASIVLAMADPIMGGLGYSRFLVERFNSKARMAVSKAAPETSVGLKGACSSDEISRRSTAEDEEEEELADGGSQADTTKIRDLRATVHVDEPPLSTQQSYERIARIATHAAEQIDWRQLRHSTSLWDEKKRLSASPNFSIYTRVSRGMHYIMAVGTLSCSLSELQSILRPTTTAKYRAVMVELYGEAFVDGSIQYQPVSTTSPGRHRTSSNRSSSNRHTGRTRKTSASQSSIQTRPSRAFTTVSTATPSGERPSYRPRHYELTTRDADLSGNPRRLNFMAKTATFAKAHVFAKAQQWSFLECFLESPEQSGFTVAMSSLGPSFSTDSESRSLYDKAKSWISGPIEQLQGITAAYSVTPVATSHDRSDSGKSEVQVMFYSKFAEDSSTFGPFKRQTYKLTLRAHLLQMARATTRLPTLVRRRRLEALSPSDNRAFTLSNPLCICCTTTLHFLKAKSRCHACGYFVCDKCSIAQAVEVVDTCAQLVRTRVCQPCVQRLDQAVYARVSTLDRFSGNDNDVTTTTTTAASMANLLDRVFHTGPGDKRQAVLLAAKYAFDSGAAVATEQSRSSTHQLRMRRRHASPTRHRSSSLSASSLSVSIDSDSFANTEPHSEKDYLRALQNHVSASHVASGSSTSTSDRVITRATLQDGGCVTNDDAVGDFTGRRSNKTRSQSQDDNCHVVGRRRHRAVTGPVYPEPRNDAHRSKMAREVLAAIEDVASSLEVICSIASKELACPVALVTVVATDTTHVVASNAPQYHGLVVPRSESICAFTVLAATADEALEVQRPELDVRFRDLALVRQQRLQFYCGFPLTSRDGSVVGALCCGDFAASERTANDAVRAMTPQQTAAMRKLAATASRVMQLRGKRVYKRL